MDPGDIAPVIVIAILTFVAGAVMIFRGPLGRALARRIEGTVGESRDLDARLSDLEARLAAGEHERAELVERLDFTERMLLEAKNGPKELPG